MFRKFVDYIDFSDISQLQDLEESDKREMKGSGVFEERVDAIARRIYRDLLSQQRSEKKDRSKKKRTTESVVRDLVRLAIRDSTRVVSHR